MAPQDFAAEHVTTFSQTHGLPLLGLEEPTYPTLCRMAATNPSIGRQRKTS